MARGRHAPSPTAPSSLRPTLPSRLRVFVRQKYALHRSAILPCPTLHPHPISAKARPANESPAFTLV